MRIFSGSCLMLLSPGENGEDTLCMYFIKHFSHPRDLPKSEQEVTERQSMPVSTYVEEEERDLKQLSGFLYMRWGLLLLAKVKAHSSGRRYLQWVKCPLAPASPAFSTLGGTFPCPLGHLVTLGF